MNLVNVIFDKKFRKFILTGAFNTFLGFLLFPAVYLIFSSYRDHYFLMLSICQFVCIANSYLTNKYLVFRTQGNYFMEMMKFSMFHGFYIMVSLISVWFFVEGFKINPVIVQSIVSVANVFTSYLWYNYVTFLKKPKLIQ